MQPQEISVLEWVWRIVTTLVIPATVAGIVQIFRIRLRLALYEQRTCVLEEQMKNSPGNDLTISITALQGEVKALREAFAAVTEIVRRHESYLWEQGGKK